MDVGVPRLQRVEAKVDDDLESGSDRSAEDLRPQDPNDIDTKTDTSIDPAHAPPHLRSITGVRWFLICIAIFSANILYGLDTTIAADIQSPVAETFNEISQLGWLGVGFALGSVAFILPLGKAYAVFDTKWLFIGCVTMFAAGSALCGAAPNMDAIIVGRVWAGAGGAGMYLGNINLITILTTPKEQPFYIGIIGLIYGTGCILGPVIGGAFSDSSATWRWAFYLNLCLFGVMSPIYIFMLPSLPRRPGTTFTQRVKSMDWLGTLLNAGLYVSFVLFLSFGGVNWGWGDGRTIACAVVFVVLTAAFAVTQILCVWTTEEDRLFPCEMVMNRTLLLLYIMMAAGGAALFVAIYYIPLYFQFVNGDSGIISAVRLLPFVCFYVATIIACGSFMAKTGYFIWWYLASGVLMLIGGVLMYTVHRDTAIANIYGYSIILGIGMTTTQAGYAVGPTLVSGKRVHEVIQFMNIAQGQSQLLGLAIASALFQSLTFDGLYAIFHPLGTSDAEIRGAVAGAQSELLSSSPPALQAQAQDVIVGTIDRIYIMVIAAGCVYVICSAMLPRKRVV